VPASRSACAPQPAPTHSSAEGVTAAAPGRRGGDGREEEGRGGGGGTRAGAGAAARHGGGGSRCVSLRWWFSDRLTVRWAVPGE
jgi:hypothetical protein